MFGTTESILAAAGSAVNDGPLTPPRPTPLPARGRKLLPPVGEVTRPITDRAKQSLFDVITPLVEAARVYDCFAGTGSMGLDCLSRGAAHATPAAASATG